MDLFCIKEVLKSSFIFRFILMIIYLSFLLTGIIDYYYIIPYIIFICLTLAFIKCTNKISFICKILFIIIFWILFISYIDILLSIKLSSGNVIILIAFSLDLIDNMNHFGVEDTINQLNKAIEKMNLSNKSSSGFGQKEPGDPKPENIVYIKESHDSEDNNYIYDYLSTWLINYRVSILNDIIISDYHLLYKNELYYLFDLEEKIKKYNYIYKTNNNILFNNRWFTHYDWILLKKGITTDLFPDVFSYIQGPYSGLLNIKSIADISPKFFLLGKYESLAKYSIIYDGYIKAKVGYDLVYPAKAISYDQLDVLMKKNIKLFDDFQKRQILIFLGSYLETIEKKFNNGLIEGLDRPLINFLDKKVVYSESLENIMYVSFVLLENKATIDYCVKYGIDNILNLNSKEETIIFYNKIYKDVKNIIVKEYSTEYKHFVGFWVERISKGNLNSFAFLFNQKVCEEVYLDNYTYDKPIKSLKKLVAEDFKYYDKLYKNKYIIKSKFKVKIKPKVKFKHNMYKYKYLKYSK